MRSRSWRATGVWLLCSFLVAAVGFGVPWLTGSSAYWSLSTWLAFAWIVMILVALVILRWRGLLLLIGAPLALYYPFVAYWIISACAENINMCP
jgi:hypothetical protein